MTFFSCSFAVVCSCVMAYAQDPGSIRGTVANEKTGEPIPFVNIILKGTGIGAASSVDGRYDLWSVPPGTQRIVASAVGFETQEIEAEVRSGQETTIEIRMSEKSVLMNDVTIYGASLRTEKVTDAPAAVSVLNAREIVLNSGSGQIPKLLETQPGVDIVQSGVSDYNVNTRGFNSSLNRRLLVLLDGRDLAVVFLGSQEWNGLSIPVEDLARMELIRGPGSALYGANAFNGVVNILTPSPKEIQGGKITLAGGELNSLRTDVRYAALAEDISFKLNVGRAQSDSWSVSRLDPPGTDPPTFEYSGLNPFLNGEIAPVDGGKVSSSYGSARADYVFGNGSASTIEGGVTQVENEILVTGIGRIQVPKAVKPWGRINYASDAWFFQAWGTGRSSIEPQVSLSTGLPLEEKSFVGQLDGQYRFSAVDDRLFFVLGGAHRYQSVDTEGTLTLAAHHDNATGLYVQAEFKWSPEFKSVAAARWDRSTLHHSRISPKLAVVWSPSSSHSFRATFNQAFQAPNYSELFLYVKHPIRNLAYFGNENLTVETITGYELGYKGVLGDALFLTVDAYYNLLKDFITDLAPGVNPAYPGLLILPGESFGRTIWSYGNAGSVHETGFEVAANYVITSALQANINYAFFDFEIQEQHANDVLLPNAPKHKGNAGLTYFREPLEINVSLKYIPSYDWAAGIYKGRILAYALVNLAVSVQLTEVLSLGANITNLLDREHYEIFGGSLIGRRALVSVTARF